MSSLNLTKGGLSPAKITNLATNKSVNFMFNPYEYTLSKQNSWNKKPVIGKNLPQVTFQQGGAQTLSLTLYFDSLEAGSDVRVYTDELWKMMMIDDSTENAKSGKGAPPPVAFEWGRLYFKAIITNMSQKFTLFKADGTPLRCTVTISLEQFLDENDFVAQTPGQSSGQGAPSSTTVREGDRLDHVASSSGSDHRTVAENNNIDNPLNVPTGTSLNT